jgi:hypothetical protein
MSRSIKQATEFLRNVGDRSWPLAQECSRDIDALYHEMIHALLIVAYARCERGKQDLALIENTVVPIELAPLEQFWQAHPEWSPCQGSPEELHAQAKQRATNDPSHSNNTRSRTTPKRKPAECAGHALGQPVISGHNLAGSSHARF